MAFISAIKLPNNTTHTLKDSNAIPTSQKGAASGVVPLNASSKIDSIYLPSYVDDVIEGYYYNGKFYEESSHTTEITGEAGKIYVDLTTNKSYRYSGSAFIEMSSGGSVVTISRSLTSGTKSATITIDGTSYDIYSTDNTTYGAGTGINLSGTTFSVKLGYTTSGNNRAVQADSNGNLFVTQKDDNTWTALVGATASANGSVGYINAAPPKDGYNTKFFRADGTWAVPNYPDVSGKIDTAGAGLSKSGTTLGHTNNVTAQSTQAVYPIKIDGQGHISAYGSAVTLGAAAAKGVTDNSSATAVTSTDTNLITGRTLYYAGYTKNAGTITGVTAGTGLSGGGTSGSVTLNHSNSVTAGTASEGGSTRTLAFGGTFKVPSVSYDAQGHVTSKGSVTLTLPANPNTDTKVTQTAKTDNVWRKLLSTYNSASTGGGSITSGTTNVAYYDVDVALNASKSAIYAGGTYYIGNIATSDDIYKNIVALGWSDVFA